MQATFEMLGMSKKKGAASDLLAAFRGKAGVAVERATEGQE